MEALGEQEDQAVGGTMAPGLREVVEGGVGVNKVQDELPERATDVKVLQRTADIDSVQDEALQRAVKVDKDHDQVLEMSVDVNKVQDEVLGKSVTVPDQPASNEVLKRAEDVHSIQDEVLEREEAVDNVQDEVLEREEAVDNVQDEVLEREEAVDNVQDEVLEREEAVDNVQDEVLEREVDADSVQDKVLDGTVYMDKARNTILVGGVDMDQVQVEFMKVSVDKDKVQDENPVCGMDVNKALDQPLKGNADLDKDHDDKMKSSVNVDKVQDDVLDDRAEPEKGLEADLNGEKVQETNLKGTRDESNPSIKVSEDGTHVDSALEKILENGVDVLSEHERMDTMRCQVKITTRHSLRLHMANHTARDVYVRLLDHGERISGSGLLALKDSVHLSPMKPLVTPEEVELEESECLGEESGEEDSILPGAGLEKHEQVVHGDEEDGCLAISDMAYSPCASVMPTPVEEPQGGVDILFQSPGRLLKDLHADPEIQEELLAERERELAREAIRQSLCSQSNDTTQLRAFLSSTVRLVVVASVLLLLLLILLLVLLESDLEVTFLEDIRETPEFEQFHYEYYCPLRRWLCYKLMFLTELLWGD